MTAVMMGVLLGIVSFLTLFGLDRALGTDPVYQWPAGDQAQHIAGAFAYLDAAWGLPIFDTDRINYPEGINIIFTDSAPFAGFVAKVIHSLSGLRFNYLGSWFAVLWIGQAAGGAYLAWQAGTRHSLVILSAATLALAWPPFLNRHFHLALGSHFLLLFALGLYLKTVRLPALVTTAIAWSLLLGIALWTHAYLFLMALAVCIAAYGDALLQRRAELVRTMALLSGIAGWCIGLALLGGYQTAGDINAQGYGSFQLDVLSYVWPHGSAIWEAPVIFSPQSAFEGFNYLGMGALLCVLTGLLFLRSSHARALVCHPLFVLCILGMLAFAVTNNVTLAGQQLIYFSLPIENFPFSTFRASGRFGWLFGYVLAFGLFFLVVRSLSQRSRRMAAAFALAIAALQTYDAHDLLVGMQNGWTTSPRPALETEVSGSSFVHFWPPIDCLSEGVPKTAAIEALAVVARAGKPTDGAHIARGAKLECPGVQQQPVPGALLITTAEQPVDLPGSSYHCAQEELLKFCRPR